MPGGNPLISTGRNYGAAQAAAGAGTSASKSAEIMPVQLAVLLLVAAGGLWALKMAGFRFVVEVGASGGK